MRELLNGWDRALFAARKRISLFEQGTIKPNPQERTALCAVLACEETDIEWEGDGSGRLPVRIERLSDDKVRITVNKDGSQLSFEGEASQFRPLVKIVDNLANSLSPRK